MSRSPEKRHHSRADHHVHRGVVLPPGAFYAAIYPESRLRDPTFRPLYLIITEPPSDAPPWRHRSYAEKRSKFECDPKQFWDAMEAQRRPVFQRRDGTFGVGYPEGTRRPTNRDRIQQSRWDGVGAEQEFDPEVAGLEPEGWE